MTRGWCHKCLRYNARSPPHAGCGLILIAQTGTKRQATLHNTTRFKCVVNFDPPRSDFKSLICIENTPTSLHYYTTFTLHTCRSFYFSYCVCAHTNTHTYIRVCIRGSVVNSLLHVFSSPSPSIRAFQAAKHFATSLHTPCSDLKSEYNHTL